MGWRKGEATRYSLPYPNSSEIRDTWTKGEPQGAQSRHRLVLGKDRGHSRNCILAFPGRRENPSSEPGTKPSLLRSSKGTAPSSGALMSLFRQFANYFPGTVHPNVLCCGDSAGWRKRGMLWRGSRSTWLFLVTHQRAGGR